MYTPVEVYLVRKIAVKGCLIGEVAFFHTNLEAAEFRFVGRR